MRNAALPLLFVVTLFAAPTLLSSVPASQGTPVVLEKPGRKIPIGAEHYFVFGFTAQPKLGAAVMRVEIFHNDGRRDTGFGVKGDLDMPSMRGAHSSGSKPFILSAKGVYLLPVQLAMPGGWEFRLTFDQGGKPVFDGIYLFEL